MKRPMVKQMPSEKTGGAVDSVRSFNRFYTQKIGVLADRLLGTEYSLPEARILFELNYSGTLSVSELAKDLGVDRGYMSRLTASMERRQLVKRLRSDSDARIRLLSLTKDGKRAFTILNRRSSKQVEQVLSALTQDSQAKLASAMATIQDVLEHRSAKGKPVLIRPHRSGDLGWIVERHGAIYQSEYGFDVSFEALVAEILAKLIKKFDDTKEHIWIAEINGERAGSIVLARASRNTGQLRLFLVEPWARGHGVGKALLQESVRFAREAGYKDIMLWTQSVLRAAAHLYRATGFKVVSKEKHRSFGQDLVAQIWKIKLN